jgi:peptidoglycan hydrolase CwlO-like protein
VEEAKKMVRSKRIAQTLKNHIGEAEMQRKPVIRHTYTSSYIKKRRQNEYRDLERQLIENQTALEEYRKQIEEIQGLCSVSNEAVCKRKDELMATYQGTINAIENRLRNAKRTHSFLKKQIRSVSGGYTRKLISKRV